jgi:hypothetical protein
MENKYIDAALERGAMSLANRGDKTHPNNAKFRNPDHRNEQVNVEAIKNIKNGQEIFLGYGSNYRMNDAEFNTKNIRKK